MKKITILFTLFTSLLVAQQKNQVIYAVTGSKHSPYIESEKGDLEAKQLLREVETKLPEISYNLNFTPNESYFSLIESVQNEGDSDLSFNLARSKGGDDIYYTNKKKDKVIRQREFEGEYRLIHSKFNHHQWKLINEKRIIKGLICYKAITTFTYETLTETLVEPVVAWYCPTIPFPYGPVGYTGLPGLILELDNGRATFYAIQIKLNTKEKIKIKEPTKGIKMTIEEDRKRERAWLDDFLIKNDKKHMFKRTKELLKKRKEKKK